jgi:prephenate dehydrogenase
VIGTSLGLALTARGVSREAVVFEPEAEAREQIARRGLAAVDRLDSLPPDPDAVWLAAPPAAIERLLPEVARRAPRALVTDTASVKRSILEAAARVRRQAPAFLFVGSHPMAGSERSGAAAAAADLFLGSPVAICRLPGVPEAAAAQVARAWQLAGGVPLSLTAEEHDAAVALTSHLPQLAASALAAFVARRAIPESYEEAFLGPGFRDTTRLAGSSPSLWAEILQRNEDHVRPLLEALARDLAAWAGPSPAGSWEERLAEGRRFRRRLEGE